MMKKRWTTLWALARCPFLSSDDLGALLGTGARTARARLLRLCHAGLVECIYWPQTREHLYYLSPAGIVAAAQAAETTPEALKARYGLGERALLRRMPALERLIGGRRVLIALHCALVASGGALEEWRAWPVAWSYSVGGRRRLLHLDGEGIIRQSGHRPVPQPFGLLWDGDSAVPPGALAERLARLDLVRQSDGVGGDSTTGVPPVLLVTAAPDRVPPSYRPDLLWTTDAEIADRGILGAAWHGSGLSGEALPLRLALAALGLRPCQLPRNTSQSGPDPTSPPIGTERPYRFQQRGRAMNDNAAESCPSLLPLVLPPRAYPLLALVGQHPLLSAAAIARAADASPVDTWLTLGLLRRHGLVHAWTPAHDRRTRRHLLTHRGLRLLAQRVGLAPQDYRRLYGILDHAEGKARRALDFARVNLFHTDGINQLYLALLGAARTSGDLWWRGEWACTRTYLDGPERRVLRPDAEGLYTGPTGTLHFFVEVDRGTAQLWYLATKLEYYARYRDATEQSQVTLLLVTKGQGRGWGALQENDLLPARTGMAPLDLRVTTLVALAEHGPQARFWCTASRAWTPFNALSPQMNLQPAQPELASPVAMSKG